MGSHSKMTPEAKARGGTERHSDIIAHLKSRKYGGLASMMLVVVVLMMMVECQ